MALRFALLVSMLLLIALVAGCGPSRPNVVEARGVVLLDNQPLPNAVVEFIPVLEGFGSEMNSTATTDEQGRFTLKSNWQNQNGAASGKNKVVVYEGAPPGAAAESRERGSRSRVVTPPVQQFNRPIPQKYGSVGSTPLEVEVKPGQAEYKIEMTRQ
jgi:hypothetical protein